MASLLAPTSIKKAALGGAFNVLKNRYVGASGWKPVKLSYVGKGGVWKLIYSTPGGTLSGGGANAASGASSSGRAQVNATANPGGNNSGNLSYSWQNGGALNYLNSTSQTITAYFDFTGVANGTTSGALSNSGLYCIITDNVTGAQWQTDPITVGPLTWTNTVPAYGPFTAGSAGASSSGSSSAGAGHTINDIATVSAGIGVVGGGPTSGSFTYSWSITSGPSFASATLSGANSATCSINFNWNIPQATTRTNSVTLSCTMTDTVSGYSSTATGIVIERQYTNNTG